MLLLGHTGVGAQLAHAFNGGPLRASLFWILVGTLLPDMIDKPLYYVWSSLFQASSRDLGLISGTRTVGHTLLFLFGLYWASQRTNSKILFGLFLGACTHVFVDNLTDLLWTGSRFFSYQRFAGLVFPFIGLEFMATGHKNMTAHAQYFIKPRFALEEGAGVLAWLLYWKGHRLSTSVWKRVTLRS